MKPSPTATVSDHLLAPFARKTSSGRYLPEVDGLRFVAIAWVALFHMREHFFFEDPWQEIVGMNVLGFLAHRGHFGVQLFFAISGFILSLPFAMHHLGMSNKPVVVKSFYWRRVTRLEPPYVICLLALFLYHALHAPDLGAYLSESLPHLAASAGYLQQPIYSDWSTINHVAWSLEIEIQFYLLAPLICQVFRIASTIQRRLLFILSIIASALFHETSNGLLFRYLPGQLHYFLIGLLLVDFYLVTWNQEKSRHHWWDWLGLISWTLLPNWPLLRPFINDFLPVLTFFAFAGTLRGNCLSSLFRIRWLTVIGGMCYTIYLYHITIFGCITHYLNIQVGNPLSVGVNLAVTSLGVLFFSSILFLLIERPCMDPTWPAKLRKRFSQWAR